MKMLLNQSSFNDTVEFDRGLFMNGIFNSVKLAKEIEFEVRSVQCQQNQYLEKEKKIQLIHDNNSSIFSTLTIS